MAEARLPMTAQGGEDAMSRLRQKLIHAGKEAAAIALGEALPGAVVHLLEAEPRPGPDEMSPGAAPVRETESDSA